jgi:hypothetical protein
LGQCGGIEPGTHVVSAHSGWCQKWVTGHLVGVGEMVGELHTFGCLKWTRHCRSESRRPVAEGVVRIELWRRSRLSCWLEGQIGSLRSMNLVSWLLRFPSLPIWEPDPGLPLHSVSDFLNSDLCLTFWVGPLWIVKQAASRFLNFFLLLLGFEVRASC